MTISPFLRLMAVPVFVLAAGCASSGARPASGEKAQVTAADIESNPDESIEHMIQRKVPGVSVYKNADGRIALYLRGAVTVDSNHPKPPLYVVDQLPMSAGPDGEIPVNPYDIETIKVLRGADATIYGIDGANGVIVITLKRGKTKEIRP